jgi:uncharacterized membrane protein
MEIIFGILIIGLIAWMIVLQKRKGNKSKGEGGFIHEDLKNDPQEMKNI